jgi:hypothetical protein
LGTGAGRLSKQRVAKLFYPYFNPVQGLEILIVDKAGGFLEAIKRVQSIKKLRITPQFYDFKRRISMSVLVCYQKSVKEQKIMKGRIMKWVRGKIFFEEENRKKHTFQESRVKWISKLNLGFDHEKREQISLYQTTIFDALS